MAPTNFAEAQEVLAANLPGYAPRPAQMAMAAQIEAALADSRPGLMQAGTGTGKSLAILIPLILHAKATGQTAVVATATKALQNQYSDKDLPFLAKYLGVPFDFGTLKGRGNYPCFAQAARLEHPTREQREVLEQMDKLSTPQAIAEGRILDREMFPALTNRDWIPFSMSAAECPGRKSCPFAEKCFAERAKDKAAAADIVITNTSMLMTDLQLRHATGGSVALLGDIGVVAVDEAHTLPEAATKALEDTMARGALGRLASDLDGYLVSEDSEAGPGLELAIGTLFDHVTAMYAAFVESQHGKADPMPLSQARIITELGSEITALYQEIDRVREEVKDTRPVDDHGKLARQRLMRRTDDWMCRLRDYATDEPERTVRWVEQDTYETRGQRRTRILLRSAPISVAGFLREAMWSEFPVIMSSATLTTGTKKVNGARVPDFDYLAEMLGLGRDEAIAFDAGSPFDFPRQSRLYVPGKDFPSPERATQSQWRAGAQAVTAELVKRSGGGALLLFTSRTAMNESYQALGRLFRNEGLLVLKQDDYPAPEMVRQFREHGNGVIFGLRTFFEGIDIPTKALRLVVIDKLPFAVPSDILIQARVDALIRKYNDRWAGFTRMTIPSMVLVLTQAFGRLIRHADDRGLVAILDNRLRTKRYGAGILDALPPATQIEDVHEALAYMESIR